MADESTPTLPVSPTGAPIVSPAAFKIIALVVMLALAVLGVLVAEYPDTKGFTVALQILSAVAGLLGIASPGLRKASSVGLLLVALSMSSCKTMSAVQPAASRVADATFDCAAKEIAQQVLDLRGPVHDALSGSTTDWEPTLDRLVASAGDVGICAVKGAASELLAALTGAGAQRWSGAFLVGPDRMTELQLSRAQKYLTANGVR